MADNQVLDLLIGFEDWVKTVNIRQFSKTRKVRRSEDSIFYDSKQEPKKEAALINVRQLPSPVETLLQRLNQAYKLSKNPTEKRILLLEYDILIEKFCGDPDGEDSELIHSLQEDLLQLTVRLPAVEVESLCL